MSVHARYERYKDFVRTEKILAIKKKDFDLRRKKYVLRLILS